MSDLAGAIDRLTSQSDLTALLYHYAELMDAGDFAGIGRLLSHSSISVEGGQELVTGGDAIEATYTKWSTRYPDTGTPKTKHVMTNVIVNVGDDTNNDGGRDAATMNAYFTVLQAVEGTLPLQPILAGRYRHMFERIDGTWRFTRFHVLWDLSGELSSHVNSGVE